MVTLLFYTVVKIMNSGVILLHIEILTTKIFYLLNDFVQCMIIVMIIIIIDNYINNYYSLIGQSREDAYASHCVKVTRKELQERLRGCGGGKPEKPASLLSFSLNSFSSSNLHARLSFERKRRERRSYRYPHQLMYRESCRVDAYRPQVRETRRSQKFSS